MNDTILGVIIGAASTVIAGALSSEYSSWRNRSSERKALKIAICDELTEQVTIIKNMQEVWEKTQTLVPSYINDLKSCSESYNSLRQRFFLIKDKETRTKIVTYYKDLKNAIYSKGKYAGSLSKSDKSQNEQKEIADKFDELKKRAEDLIKSLQ